MHYPEKAKRHASLKFHGLLVTRSSEQNKCIIAQPAQQDLQVENALKQELQKRKKIKET